MRNKHTFTVDVVKGDFRPLHTGALFPDETLVHAWDDDHNDTVIFMRLRVVDGRPVLIEFGVRQNGDFDPVVELQARYIHSLAIDELVTEAIRSVGVTVAGALIHQRPSDPATEGDLAVRSRKRRLMTEALLSEVAQVVRDNPDAPIKAVQETMFCSYRTAGRWVAAARDALLIPPARSSISNKKEGSR